MNESPRSPSESDLAADISADAPTMSDASPTSVARGEGAPGRSAPTASFLIAVSALLLALDWLSKRWAEKRLEGQAGVAHTIDIIPGWFDLALARNRGAAWSMFADADERVRAIFFPTVSSVAIVVVVVFYRRLRGDQRALKWALPLVLGGALGNLVDRLHAGFVIDFLHVSAMWHGQRHHFPTFNVADIAISVGAGLMALDTLLQSSGGGTPLTPRQR